MADNSSKPVVSDDMQAGILAAMKRAESIPEVDTLIDTISDEEWLSDESATWNITAGSAKFVDEIDSLDAEVNSAA